MRLAGYPRVAVDRGGTWVRVQALVSHRARVKTYQGRSVPLTQLRGLLARLLRRWRIRPHTVRVASRGLWPATARRRLQRSLHGLAPRIETLSDVEASWRGAFGPQGEGVLVLAGTGSIALARSRKGQFYRAGGKGPERGDEGSAFWIGWKWHQHRSPAPTLPRASLTVSRVRHLAALAPKVLRRAQAGDPLAKKIRDEAFHHLVRITLAAGRHLPGKRWRVSWAGGLMESPHFRRGFFRALRQKTRREGIYLQVVRPRQTPLAALLGLNP